VHIAHKRLGRRVRELRVQRGWTQEELAARAGKHWTYIGGIERGERNPTVLVLADIARAFGVGISDLFSSGKRASR
jgi:transcriptional regulator with XRE-family HTH domain